MKFPSSRAGDQAGQQRERDRHAGKAGPRIKCVLAPRDSVAAADLELSADDLDALDPQSAAQGNRYGEAGMRMVRL